MQIKCNKSINMSFTPHFITAYKTQSKASGSVTFTSIYCIRPNLCPAEPWQCDTETELWGTVCWVDTPVFSASPPGWELTWRDHRTRTDSSSSPWAAYTQGERRNTAGNSAVCIYTLVMLTDIQMGMCTNEKMHQEDQNYLYVLYPDWHVTCW